MNCDNDVVLVIAAISATIAFALGFAMMVFGLVTAIRGRPTWITSVAGMLTTVVVASWPLAILVVLAAL